MKLLTFDEFEPVMISLEKMVNFENELYKMFAENHIDFCCDYFPSDIVIHLLNLMFGENDYSSIITYWVEELDFGNEHSNVPKWDEYNGEVKLETTSDLYDALLYRVACRKGSAEV